MAYYNQKCAFIEAMHFSPFLNLIWCCRRKAQNKLLVSFVALIFCQAGKAEVLDGGKS